MMKPQDVFITALALCAAASAKADDVAANQKDDQAIETLVITASPLNRNVLESASPVSVLAGEELESQVAPTLGETLKNMPGVNSSYYGPVASTPIIRGLTGPRIKIVQNGLDSSDASRVGPDHLVSAEASTASQIEVLRGPATLIYGSGAIGGVVNVVDSRLPNAMQNGASGAVSMLHNTVSNENNLAANLDTGSGNFALHLDGFKRKTHDYEIPAAAVKGSDDITGTLNNSAIDADGYTLGTGWINEDSRAVMSYGRLNSEYGLPSEEDVFIRMQQDRYQMAADRVKTGHFFNELHWRAAFSDYQHSEIEDGEIGTTFKNKTIETRLWANHEALNGWKGVVGGHYTHSDFSALGEEAFTPASITDSKALFVLEEKPMGAWLWQLGGRIEYSSIDPDNDFFANSENQELQGISFAKENYTSLSFSAGTVWSLDKNSSVALNLARAERAPSSAEIFSNGPHLGSGIFELGAGFEVIVEGENFSVVQSAKAVDKEVSTNLDVTYRYNSDAYKASISVFYNAIDNYLYEENTGAIFSSDEEETNGLPVFIFRQQDADLYGFEAELDWHLSDTFRLDTFADYTRATLKDDSDAPRIPAMRVSSTLHWEQDSWHGEVGFTHYAKQDKTAFYETETDGYTLVNASISYYLPAEYADTTLFLRGNNLTDKDARVHTSFIKDVAPLPGRSIAAGIKVKF